MKTATKAIIPVLSTAALLAATFAILQTDRAAVPGSAGIVVAAAAGADGPATKPVRVGEMRRAIAADAAADAPLTEEEWGKAVTFMEQYSPNRLHALQEGVGPDSPRYNELRKFINRHYRELSQLKDRNDTEIYNLRVKTIQAEDEFWGLRQKLRETPESQRDPIRQQLRAKVAEQLELGDRERQLRITRLEKVLAEEKEKLEADKGRMAQRVDERYRMLIRPQVNQGKGKGKREEPASNTTTASPVK
jgi:hypothetical protein